MGEVIGQEARALGVTQLFAPLADLARELRYGRVCAHLDIEKPALER
jgi:beta-glucosidase